LIRQGTEVDVADFTGASYSTSLAAKVIAGTVIPLPDMTLETGENVASISVEKAGKKIIIKEGERRSWYRLTDIWGCLQNKLQALNNGRWSMVIIDSLESGVGRTGSTSAKLKGITLNQLYFTKPNIIGIDDASMDEVLMYVAFDPSETQSLSYFKMGFPSSDALGVTTGVVTKVSNSTSIITVNVVEGCNGSSPVTGLLAANFTLAQAGSSVVITGVTESTTTAGQYAIATTITENPYIVTVVATTADMYASTATTLAYAQ
jgi:hypothetical protein